ncbi:MAG: SUMF1/EgtB/PvdO family nonheme iron enzyme [Bacteroidota bacterium]
MKIIPVLGTLLFMLISISMYGNGIQVSDIKIIDGSAVEIHISWQNSWNTPGIAPNNKDGAWFFMKYRDAGSGSFRPLVFSPDSTAHRLVFGNLLIKSVKEKTGVLVSIKSNTAGIADGIIALSLESPLPPGNYDFRAFAVEMVYVPAGPFYLGDSISNYSFAESSFQDNCSPLFVSQGAADLILHDVNLPGMPSGPLQSYNVPQAFPFGNKAFWLMKYEISQQQFADYLNTLNREEQEAQIHIRASDLKKGAYAMVPPGANPTRNGIIISAEPAEGQALIFACNANNNSDFNDSTDGQSRACNWLSWHNTASFLAWAGLRPITEPEYEKACRGPISFKPKELAWGTDSMVVAVNLIADGSEKESVVEKGKAGAGLCRSALPAGQAYSPGPARCGFAASGISSRAEAGAGYYGAMELSGNLWEPVISLKEGTEFLGTQNGIQNPDWPAADAKGVILRGGSWLSLMFNSFTYPFRDGAVSDRFYRDLKFNDYRSTTGGRGGLSDE